MPAMQPSSEVDIFSAHLPGLSPAGGQQGGHAPVLPTDFDPFGPEDAGPAMPDNRPVLQDVFTPPRATMPDLLPGDWDATPPPAPAGQTGIGSAPLAPADYSPFASMQSGMGMPPPSLNPQEVLTSPQAQMPGLLPDDWDLSPRAAPAASGTLNIPVAPPSNPFAVPPAQMAASMAAPMPAMAPPLPASTALHPPQAAPQAMMAPLDTSIGMGLQVPTPSPATQQTMSDHQTALVLLSAAVAGMRALLTASEDARRALGNTQSILPSNAGDPLRFAASDEAVAMAMLGGVGASAGAGNPSALPGTVDDVNAHKLATMAASKAAARALLARLAPAVLEAEGPFSDFMPGAREKRLWKGYKKLHRQLADEFDDDFDFAFRKAFAQAYDEACKMMDKGSR
jgi:predicted component of type VI protein secretion system